MTFTEAERLVTPSGSQSALSEQFVCRFRRVARRLIVPCKNDHVREDCPEIKSDVPLPGGTPCGDDWSGDAVLKRAMKSIFLVNPFSGRGHLDAYARLYSRALLELGYRVVLVAEADAGTPDYLRRNAVEKEAFSFVAFGSAPPTLTSEAIDPNAASDAMRARLRASERARLVWQEEGLTGILRRLFIVPWRVARGLVPESVRVPLAAAKRKIRRTLSQFQIIRRLRNYLSPDAGRVRFQAMLQHVGNAALICDVQPDLVFFLYLDLMVEQAHNVASLDEGRLPWAGIRFHPSGMQSSAVEIERYFKSRNARGGIFLVPAAVDIYARAKPDLKFALAPDVADLECAADPPLLAETIRSRAAGRTIVLQVGSIAPHKGIATLLDVIARADPKRFFFALVGEVFWKSFGPNERRISEFYAHAPENVEVYDGYVEDERDYNSLVACSDIIYAVYSNFNSSSNSLSKAAGLRRPIVVAGDTLMGKRVQASQIGMVAAEGNAGDILAVLESVAARSRDSFGFDRYQAEHSLGKLKSVLADAVPVWLADRRS
jgi:hypothetical protein